MLEPLSKSVTEQKGVGPKRAEQLEKLGITTVEDLLYYFPRKYIDRRNVVSTSSLVPGSPAVLTVTVTGTARNRLRKNLELLTAHLSDDTGVVVATWFNRKGLEYILRTGTEIVVYGTPQIRGNKLELSNPDFEVVKESTVTSDFCGIVPVYSSTAGLHDRWFRKFISEQVELNHLCVREILPASIIEKRSLLAISEAIKIMHKPPTEELWKQARYRLAYDELFLIQSKLAFRRKKLKEMSSSPAITADGPIYKKFRKELPFKLTNSQEEALSEILNDVSFNIPMSRLLQGDVGSGKTIIAVALAAAASDSSVQTALLAPTEVLADQLYCQMNKFLTEIGVKVVLHKGALKESQKKNVLADIKAGKADVIVGTQSLLEDKVKFRNLGVVIIDEQHRFGVKQRATLIKREKIPHMLLMSATPIPRTLTMCLFGDLDISLLKDKPTGRKNIETRIIDESKSQKLFDFLVKEIKSGGRVYWICPRVEGVAESEVASSKERYEKLTKILPQIRVGLLHGRLETKEKEQVLSNFREGKVQLLVSTTVVEVGVDVPEASTIIIESPEFFGLSQLHQLRGRVGRGSKRGVCILLTASGTPIPKRLNVMLDTDDGFDIAEADLSFRGSGEIDGVSQHGEANFKVADLYRDVQILLEAKEDASELILQDPNLASAPYILEKIKSDSDEILGVG